LARVTVLSIPHVGTNAVWVASNTPAIYEMSREDAIKGIYVQLSGGIIRVPSQKKATVERINDHSVRTGEERTLMGAFRNANTT